MHGLSGKVSMIHDVSLYEAQVAAQLCLVVFTLGLVGQFCNLDVRLGGITDEGYVAICS